MDGIDKLKEFLTTTVDKETAAAVRSAMKNDVPIIIDGPQGPTGKTTLCRLINDNGGVAYEAYQTLRIVLDKPVR
jgi:Flp pilus assembly CpaF family ATPase